MSYSVVFTPEAEEQLVELYRYIANDASPAVAEKFTSAIVEFCEGWPISRIARSAATTPTRATRYSVQKSSCDRLFRG
jgi:plasmid stabilization system protein ParE